MAFQTNILQDGQWVHQPMDAETVLQRYNEMEGEGTPALNPIEIPPACGILTQTVVRSPLVRWMLPVQIRGPNHNDVAFVGVSFYFLHCEKI